MRPRNLAQNIIIGFGLILLLPVAASAYTDTGAYDTDFASALDYAEQQQFFDEGSTFDPEAPVGRGDLLRIILQANGYNPGPELGSTKFEGVTPQNAPYVDRMRELGVIYFNSYSPQFSGDRPYPLWRSLSILMKLEGVPVPKLFDESNFESAFPTLQPRAFYAPTMFRAHQVGLVKINKQNTFPIRSLRRIDLITMMYNALQYEGRINQALDVNGNSEELEIIVRQNSNNSFDHTLLDNEKFPILLDVWDKVTTEYLEDGTVTEDELVYGAIQGLVGKLGDPYSEFQEPEIAAAFQSSLSNEVQGIGASLTLDDDGNVVIVTPLKESPAEAAGLQPGDIIKKIDSQSVGNMNLSEVVRLIQGEPGTSVTLEIERNTGTFDVTIERQRISIPSVEAEVTNEDVLVVTINNFGFGTVATFANLVEQVDPSSLQGVVIDLRNNPGGFLVGATEIAGYFIEAGKVVTRLEGPQINDREISPGPATFANVPTYVLINKGSASASEILAGALSDHGVATLIGDQSFGKGTVQEISTYADSSSFKLTVARWLTPNGTSINGVGLKPDIFVIITDADRAAGVDPQLNRALREIR